MDQKAPMQSIFILKRFFKRPYKGFRNIKTSVDVISYNTQNTVLYWFIFAI